MRHALTAELKVAMTARDRTRVRALRTALAAIANAEAPPQDSVPLEVRGRLADVPRLQLTGADIAGILQHEIDDRRQTIAVYRANGKDAEADELQAEIDVIAAYV